MFLVELIGLMLDPVGIGGWVQLPVKRVLPQ